MDRRSFIQRLVSGFVATGAIKYFDMHCALDPQRGLWVPAAVHVEQALSNISVEYTNLGYAAEDLFPGITYVPFDSWRGNRR